jgi:hypothetical protein
MFFSPFHALFHWFLIKKVAEMKLCNTLPLFHYFLSPLLYFAYYFTIRIAKYRYLYQKCPALNINMYYSDKMHIKSYFRLKVLSNEN